MKDSAFPRSQKACFASKLIALASKHFAWALGERRSLVFHSFLLQRGQGAPGSSLFCKISDIVVVPALEFGHQMSPDSGSTNAFGNELSWSRQACFESFGREDAFAPSQIRLARAARGPARPGAPAPRARAKAASS